ncbi:Transcription factor iacI-like protein [Cladobotryum mycophilum]|uniref:Transcription factor iacI-like protein n=1 Tax=Cladobotryum mycophilum TaxID=491253 RepID=A0ABR0SPT9_9HYPO
MRHQSVVLPVISAYGKVPLAFTKCRHVLDAMRTIRIHPTMDFMSAAGVQDWVGIALRWVVGSPVFLRGGTAVQIISTCYETRDEAVAYRKLRCDLAQPTCDNCARARRNCQGYGIQLSWPRDGDKRRSIVSNTTGLSALPSRNRVTEFLNTSVWDVSLSYTLEEKRNIASYFRTLRMPRPNSLSPFPLGANDALLLDFFNETRFQVLAPIVDEALPQFILKVALSDSSSPSNLVLQSIFAISSLQLQGHSQSLLRQSRVISILRESVMQLDRQSVLQNLIATMLLYQYEVRELLFVNTNEHSRVNKFQLSYPAKSTQDWSRYLCGAKNIIRAASATQQLRQTETVVLMDWIYYHEVLSQFSLRHWNDSHAKRSFCQGGPLARSSEALVLNDVDCPFDAVDLVSDICKYPSAKDGTVGLYANTEMKRIRELERRLHKAVGEYQTFQKSLQASVDRREMIADLHRLAALIYLNRAVAKVSDIDFQHKRLVRDGIHILKRLGSCETTWPLFILACEAHEDEQRLAMLDVFSKTRQGQQQRSTHFYLMQQMVMAIWNQHDLHVESDVDYLTTLDAVISTAPFLPSFA